MTDFRKITEMLMLSCPQREIQRECRVSPKTIVKVRKALESSGKSLGDFLLMSEEELTSMISPAHPRKARACICMEPDLGKAAMSILKGGTVKAAWKSYCEEAAKIGQRPLQYAAYSAAIKASGVGALASEASRFKAGLLVFVKTTSVVHVKKETRQIYFGIFPLSQQAFFGIQSSADKELLATVLQDMFMDIGGIPPYIHLYKTDACKNQAMLEMLSYYGAQLIGWVPKGLHEVVEGVDGYIRKQISDRNFSSEDEAINYIDKVQTEYNERNSYMCWSREELFEELDCKALISPPQHAYEQIEEKTAKIQFDYHVTYKKERYSVPPETYIASTDVILRIGKSRIEIVSEEGEIIAEHPHLPDNKFGYSTLPEHIRSSKDLAKLPWNAARFLHWANKFSPNTVNIVKKIIDSHKIEQQSYCQCYWLLSLGDKMDREGRTNDFNRACWEQKDGPAFQVYNAVKNCLE